jgi:hypothetical protein
MRSTTRGASSAVSSTTISWPEAFCSMSCRTRSRYSSRYFEGSKSVVSESMSERAIFSSRSVTSTSGPGRSSSSRGLTSSEKSIVSMTSASSFGRMAARYCLVRSTTRAMPTLLVSRMALRSRA